MCAVRTRVGSNVDMSPGGGLGQGSASTADAADEDFHTFPMEKSAECRVALKVSQSYTYRAE